MNKHVAFGSNSTHDSKADVSICSDRSPLKIRQKAGIAISKGKLGDLAEIRIQGNHIKDVIRKFI